MAFEDVTRQLCLSKGIHFKKINQGYCFEWAQLVARRCPAAEIFYIRRLVPHAFIYFSGRWYDAQKPGGTRQWQRLPLLWSCRDVLAEHDLIRWQPGDQYWRYK